MLFSLPFWAPKRKWGTGATPRIHHIETKKRNQKKKAKNSQATKPQSRKTASIPFHFLSGYQKESEVRRNAPNTPHRNKKKKAKKPSADLFHKQKFPTYKGVGNFYVCLIQLEIFIKGTTVSLISHRTFANRKNKRTYLHLQRRLTIAFLM